ncbi:MAG: hypothetical protein IK092_05775 [Muribaculaceae bacterium]|nr:hypothetical protein [Muribaculaceae bacterium]
MRKLLLSLVMLFVAQTALALPFETTPAPNIYPIHWYKLKSNGVFLGVTSYGELETKSSASSDYYLWCFVEDSSGRIVIYNKGVSKYLCQGWKFSEYMTSGYNDYVKMASGNNFYVCHDEKNKTWYLDCDEYTIGISEYTSSTFTAIEALVEDYIESGAEIVFSHLRVFNDHCTFEYDISDHQYAAEYSFFVNGARARMPYSVQRTEEVQMIDVEAKVVFYPYRVRPISATHTYEIPALEEEDNIVGDVNRDGEVDVKDVTTLINLILE